MDGSIIVAEYTQGMDGRATRAFQFELSDIVPMYERGNITEHKLRTICARLRDGYLSPPLVEEGDD